MGDVRDLGELLDWIIRDVQVLQVHLAGKVLDRRDLVA